jgi:hypothetical protein
LGNNSPTTEDKTELSLDQLLEREPPRPRLKEGEEVVVAAGDKPEEGLDNPRNARGLRFRAVVGGGSGIDTELELGS